MSNRILILSIILSIVNICYTQNFVWNKVYGGEDMENNNKMINSGSRKYNILKGYFRKKAIIGSHILNDNGNNHSQWIAKKDSSGDFIWAKKVFIIGAPNFDIYSDRYDNIYINGYLGSNEDSTRLYSNSPIIINTNKKINKNNSTITFLIKLDSNGNFLWQKLFDNLTINSIYLTDSTINCIASNFSSSYIKYETDSIYNTKLFIISFHQNGIYEKIKNILYYKNFKAFSRYKYFIEGNNLYLIFSSFEDTLYFKNLNKVFYKPLNLNKTHLSLAKINLNNDEIIYLKSLSKEPFETTNFFVTSVGYGRFLLQVNYRDSFQLNGFNKKYGNNSINTFCCRYNDSTLINITLPIINKNTSSQYFYSTSKDGYIYSYGNFYNDIEYDGIKTKRNQGNNFFMKTDSLSNVLWLIRTGDSLKQYFTTGFGFDVDKGIFFSNTFGDSIYINNKWYYSKNNSQDFILSKIYDYSITRGKVSKGPYCAGDSILIPFTKEGNFSSSNEFIAELSDENGNFDGNHRQLGKIKSNKDSFIKAALPLFDVVSSPHYRTRIISTSPQVQSYYRTDTLRLLIYSKDTANAGNDTTLCYNNSLNLKTSGGTKWRWSPGNLVTDSNARITNTLPLTETTTFRIIISDSSGCGKTDTAYKTITVLAPISIDSANATLELCNGDHVNFNLSAKGGLGTYDFKWKLIDSTQWINSFQIPIPGNGNYVYLVKADDGCSPSTTTQISSFTFSMPKISLPKDTLVCPLQTTNLKLQYQKDVFGQTQIGGKAPYTFNWSAVNSNIFSLSDSINYSFNKTDTVYASITDKCGNSDTASIEILIEKPLAAEIIQDQLCFEDTAFLNLKPDAIRKNKYIYEWFKNGNFISDDSAIEYSTKNTSTTLIAKLSDNCNESVFDTINLLPQIIADLNDIKLSVCEDNNEFIFKNQSLMNDKKLTHFDWRYSNEFTPTIKDSSTLKGSFSKAGDYTINYQVESNSACVSKDSATVTVYPKPPINISWQRTTNTFDVSQWRFNATSSFTLNNILWDFGALGSGSGSPFFKTFYNSDTVKAKVKITDVLGCSNDTLFQFYLIHRKQFFIPNAITCNNDGINDVFIIHGAEWMKEFDLKIFNRWGEMVFKSNNPLEPWIPEDKSNNLYIYTLSIFDVYNERHILKGVVEVIR